MSTLGDIATAFGILVLIAALPMAVIWLLERDDRKRHEAAIDRQAAQRQARPTQPTAAMTYDEAVAALLVIEQYGPDHLSMREGFQAVAAATLDHARQRDPRLR